MKLKGPKFLLGDIFCTIFCQKWSRHMESTVRNSCKLLSKVWLWLRPNLWNLCLLFNFLERILMQNFMKI